MYVDSQFHRIQSTVVWPWARAEQCGGRSKCWRRVATSIVERKKTGRSVDNAQRHATLEHILPARLHLLMFPNFAKIEPPSGNQAINMWACGGHFILIPWHGSWEAVIRASHVSTGSLVPFSVYIVLTSPYCFSEAHSALCRSSLQPRPLQICCEDQWLVHWRIVNMTNTGIASSSTNGKSGGKLGRCHHD